MTSPPPRYVVLDDRDPSISYIGSGWTKDSGSLDGVGTFGDSYLHTLSKTTKDGIVSLDFNGTAVKVIGTDLANDPNSDPLTFECFVDDESIGRLGGFSGAGNNWEFCEKDGLSEGLHELRIEVKILVVGQAFWLDRILYIPPPSMPLDNKVIYIENNDPAVRLDAQWTSLGDGANMTVHTNSSAQVDFVGTSLTWVAFIPTELPHLTSSGTWSIDGGPPNEFVLKVISIDSQTEYNQIYFTTQDVEAGHHTVSVTFLGSQQTTPLCLDYLYIKNGTFPSSNNNGTEQTKNPQPTAGAEGGEKADVIVGCTLGGLGFLLFILSILLFCRRWRNQRRKAVLVAHLCSPGTGNDDDYKIHSPILTKQRIATSGAVEVAQVPLPFTELKSC